MSIRIVLTDRTMSSFPVSIGTGLMLESLFNPTQARYDDKREIPKKIKLDDYGYHVYNIYTLARNILSATPSKEKNDLLKDHYFLDILFDEMFVLESLYATTKCDIVFFLPDYTKVCQALNNGKEYTQTKDYQLYGTMLALFKKVTFSKDLTLIRDTFTLPKFDKKTLITTNYPTDLLNKVGNLALMESHTGKLKERSEWYTKYHKLGSKPMYLLPFMEELLYILGEGNLIYPVTLSLRYLLLAIAEKEHWTTRTTHDKIIHDFKKNSLELYNLIIGYKKVY